MRRRLLYESEISYIPTGVLINNIVIAKKNTTQVIKIEEPIDTGLLVTKYPPGEWEPIGIIMIPTSHDVYNTGECGIASLKYASINTPDSGTIDVSHGMYFGDSAKAQTTSVVSTVLSKGKLNGSPYTYLPSDIFDGDTCSNNTSIHYYKSLSGTNYCKGYAPINTDGSRNSLYYSGTSDSNALHDFTGKEYTNALITNSTYQSNWKTASTITNSTNSKCYPAACACWRYHTTGTSLGNWYLPTCGEYGYFICLMRMYRDNVTILKEIYNMLALSIDSLIQANPSLRSCLGYYSSRTCNVGPTKGMIVSNGPVDNNNTNMPALPFMRL